VTLKEAREAFNAQVAVRYDGMIFDRIKAMRVEKVDGRDIQSLELSKIRDDGRGRSEYIVRAKPEAVELFKK
jgi:hypothetical protein